MLLYTDFHSINARARLGVTSAELGSTDSRAFRRGDTLTLSVRVPRVFCAERASLALYADSDMSERVVPANFVISCEEFDCDIYESALATGELVPEGGSGLFYFTFGVETPYGRLYVNRDGTLTADLTAADRTQLSVFAENFHTPDRFKGGMMYQIFPDRFARSEHKNPLPPHRTLNPDWENGIPQFADKPGGEVANDMFFGGDLWGIAERLDYIKSLGVDTLYLCPIFEAASNHRYDTGDYMKIDPLLGGEEAFDNLVSELKKRQMKLILDGVFNHTGADSRYFNKFGNYPGPGAFGSKRSKYRKWYTFEKDGNYRCWWGVKILPAVRSSEPSYREFICGKRGVVRHYLKKGIDGWRLDVADELSDEFLDDLRSAAKAESPESLILGEVWEDASNKVAYDRRRRYFGGRQLDSVMNYPLKEGIIDFVLTGDKKNLVSTAATIYSHYPREVGDVLMNLLGTHDTERILTVLADVGADKLTNEELSRFRLTPAKRALASERLKSAWALLCAFPGIPCIYYGDEAGMEGGRDPFNRMPFVPERADLGLTHFYRRIGAIRASETALTHGDLGFIETGDRGQLLFIREFDDEAIAVAANLTVRSWEIEFERTPVRLLGEGETSPISAVAPMSVEYFKL